MSISSRNLWRIIGFSQLIFLLSLGYFAVVVQAAELPLLGGGKAINLDRQFIDTEATFEGGALVEGTNYQAYLQTTPFATTLLSVQARIIVDPVDIGKYADLLYVAGFENSAPFDGGSDTSYVTVSKSNDLYDLDLYKSPDVWMPQLAEAPFEPRIILGREVTLEDEEGWELGENPKVSYYFVGYRVLEGDRTGTIVYNTVPIVVSTVTPSPSIPDSIFVSQITDPNSELGLIATTGKENIGVLGEKDPEGRLTKINRIFFGSQTDKNQNISITLDDDHFPKTMEFPDGSQIEFNHYTDVGATATYRDANGSIINEIDIPLQIDDLYVAAEAIEQFENSPQPTKDDPVPSESGQVSSPMDNSHCLEVMTAVRRGVDALFSGLLQFASVVSCAVATGEAILTGGAAIPLAVWACSSTVLSIADDIAEVATGNKSPFKQLNQGNNLVQGVSSCTVLRDAAGCAQFLAGEILDGALEQLKPENVCKEEEVFFGQYEMKGTEFHYDKEVGGSCTYYDTVAGSITMKLTGQQQTVARVEWGYTLDEVISTNPERLSCGDGKVGELQVVFLDYPMTIDGNHIFGERGEGVYKLDLIRQDKNLITGSFSIMQEVSGEWGSHSMYGFSSVSLTRQE